MKMHYGIARVEFLAAKQEIETMISEGYTFAMIFRKLKEKNKITMSYTSFARYASGRYLTKKEKLQNGNTVKQDDKRKSKHEMQNSGTKLPRIIKADGKVPFGKEDIDLGHDIF